MLLRIEGILSSSELARARALLGAATYADGKASAGTWARRVKNNLELEAGSPGADELNRLVVGNLYRHAAFRSAVLPHRVSAAFFARYTEGMSYGEHIDDPVMGEPQRYRSDVAVTVFISDPAEYDGGELVIQAAYGEQRIKLPPGDAIAYPASSLHRVSEVTRGERVVAVVWAQSLVRDPARREVLYDLDVARQSLERVTPAAQVTARVQSAYANLVRMWAEV